MLWCELNYHNQKIQRTLAQDTQAAVSTLLDRISCVYRDLSHWRSNQRPQKAEPKLHHCTNTSDTKSTSPGYWAAN